MRTCCRPDSAFGRGTDGGATVAAAVDRQTPSHGRRTERRARTTQPNVRAVPLVIALAMLAAGFAALVLSLVELRLRTNRFDNWVFSLALVPVAGLLWHLVARVVRSYEIGSIRHGCPPRSDMTRDSASRRTPHHDPPTPHDHRRADGVQTRRRTTAQMYLRSPVLRRLGGRLSPVDACSASAAPSVRDVGDPPAEYRTSRPNHAWTPRATRAERHHRARLHPLKGSVIAPCCKPSRRLVVSGRAPG